VEEVFTRAAGLAILQVVPPRKIVIFAPQAIEYKKK
jgi:hypothetical protein